MLRIVTIILFTLIWMACGEPDKTTTGFQKIIFHTSECYGSCPIYHLRIDKDKNVHLHVEEEYKFSTERGPEFDSDRIGYFKGRLNDTIFNKLTYLLASSELDTLSYAGDNCCDGSVKTVIIYQNGHRKHLKAMYPVTTIQPLISLLTSVCKSHRLNRSNEKFQFEGGNGSR